MTKKKKPKDLIDETSHISNKQRKAQQRLIYKREAQSNKWIKHGVLAKKAHGARVGKK